MKTFSELQKELHYKKCQKMSFRQKGSEQTETQICTEEWIAPEMLMIQLA